MTNEILPIGDEQSKAIQEVAKFGSKALDIPIGLASFIAGVLGTVPEDAVGLFGDWLRAKRIRNLEALALKTQALREARKVTEPFELPTKLAVPLFEAAADENREELQDIWARLLAAATDPKRANSVRQSFIEAVKRFDPLDALVFMRLDPSISYTSNARNYLAGQLSVSEDAVEVSFHNLVSIGVFAFSANGVGINVIPTAMGRELRKALLN